MDRQIVSGMQLGDLGLHFLVEIILVFLILAQFELTVDPIAIAL
jgi:hypothetical protein